MEALNLNDLDGLARIIDRRGIDAVPADTIQTLASQAERIGASRTLTHLMVDPTEPRPARERAFLHIGARLLKAPV